MFLFQVSQKKPLSQACGLPAQHKARPAGALSGEAVCKLANAVFKKLDRLHKQHLKEPTLHVQARATTGVGKPQADSECNERIPPDGFGVAALESTLYG